MSQWGDYQTACNWYSSLPIFSDFCYTLVDGTTPVHFKFECVNTNQLQQHMYSTSDCIAADYLGTQEVPQKTSGPPIFSCSVGSCDSFFNDGNYVIYKYYENNCLNDPRNISPQLTNVCTSGMEYDCVSNDIKCCGGSHCAATPSYGSIGGNCATSDRVYECATAVIQCSFPPCNCLSSCVNKATGFKGLSCDIQDGFTTCVHGVPVSQNCAGGTGWNDNTSRCEHLPVTYTCIDDCSVGATGSYCKKNGDPDEYIVCVHGQKYEKRCLAPLVWDDAIKNCNWP
eukprot:17491_1